jgi:HK97 family phage major capsid protein
MTVTELRERAVAEAEAARAIKDKADEEGRGLNADEAHEYDKHLQEAERIEQEANRQEKLETIEKRFNEPREKQTDIEFATGAKIEVVKPDLFRFGQLRAFKGPKAEVNAYTAGKWIMATIMGDAASRQWCRDRGVEIRVQTEGINTAGGFVVPDVMERAIIDLREEYGNARRNCRVVPMSSDHTIIPRRNGGVTAAFIGETTAITESDKSWSVVELTAKKLGALTRMSSELSEDAIINIADDLAQEMAYAFSVKEDQCCIDGDGTNTYGGMTGIRTKMIDGFHLGSYVLAITTGNTWLTIDDADLMAMMVVLPKYARANAKWHCSPIAKVAVFDRLARAGAGNTTITLGEAALNKYNGFPIEEWPAMPTTSGTMTDVIMLLLGDMRLSTAFGDRRGIVVKVSDQRYIEYDQIGIQATERFCINHHDIGGVTAAIRGPIVGLLGVA